MRSLYTLYGIAIDNSSILQDKERGICNLMNNIRMGGLITRKEYEKLITHFKANNPKHSSKFASFSLHKTFYCSVWWWSLTEEGNKQRVLFLKTLQQSVKPWYKKLSDKIWWI